LNDDIKATSIQPALEPTVHKERKMP